MWIHIKQSRAVLVESTDLHDMRKLTHSTEWSENHITVQEENIGVTKPAKAFYS